MKVRPPKRKLPLDRAKSVLAEAQRLRQEHISLSAKHKELQRQLVIKINLK